jgi:lysophospholipase L1-like esterase
MRRLFGAILAAAVTACCAWAGGADSHATALPRPAMPSPERLTWSQWWCPPGAWKARLDYKIDEIRKGPGSYDVVFVGDSITQNWEGWLTEAQRENLRTNIAAGRISFECAHIEPMKAWLRLAKSHRVLNLGVSGDRTQDMLWRLTTGGQLDGYRSRYFCVLAGTNNSDPPEDIAAGVREIVALIRRRHPESAILLMPILPRGAGRNDPGRRRNESVNRLIAACADGDKVIWLDIRDKLLEPDGTLTRKMMPDLLHPSERGYEIWLSALEPYLTSR